MLREGRDNSADQVHAQGSCPYSPGFFLMITSTVSLAGDSEEAFDETPLEVRSDTFLVESLPVLETESPRNFLSEPMELPRERDSLPLSELPSVERNPMGL